MPEHRKEEERMKKLLFLLAISSVLFCGCTNTAPVGEPETSELPVQSEEVFEEIEKVDIEISDFVEEAPEATEDTEVTQQPVKTTPAPEKTDDVVETTSPSEKPVSTPVVTPTQKPVATPTPVAPIVPEALPEVSKDVLAGKIICIDASHGKFTQNRQEQIAENSDILKPAFSEGTKGSQYIEDDITLAVANKLLEKLSALGATVIMTRTDENSTMSNVERTQYANNNNALVSIKLHADGTKEGGTGMTMLIPGNQYIQDAKLLSDSEALANEILRYTLAQTGARNRGIYKTNQMSGLNWSKIPVVLFEMGFMTSVEDEMKLADSSYQDSIAEGIVRGLAAYFN